MDRHEKTAAFIEKAPVISLCTAPKADVFNKAGLVPHMQTAQGLAYYVMKPAAKRPDFPPPQFQLCKGTRMAQAADGKWHDIKEGATIAHAEPLVQTALREGMEEVGLVLENIITLYDAGTHGFASATTGQKKEAWFFTALLRDGACFTTPDASTAECAWMTLDEFAIAGRPDHHYILSQIESLLKEKVYSSR
jgi:ADP-ribose pyrophosphatase YjhB (NUDIX family)